MATHLLLGSIIALRNTLIVTWLILLMKTSRYQALIGRIRSTLTDYILYFPLSPYLFIDSWVFNFDDDDDDDYDDNDDDDDDDFDAVRKC